MQKFQQWKILFNPKYRELVLAVGLFIILDAGVLILNYYTSYQITNDAHAIQLANKVSILSQTLFHQLYQVKDDAQDPEKDYMETIDIFADSFSLFDVTLDSFIYGGVLIGKGQDRDTLLAETSYRGESMQILKDSEEIWQDYRKKLTPIVYAYYNELERSEVLA